ncbi:GNAT family N-acetyltransferase [Herbaspirillum rubrisubalbicans]|uniref:GNAT family N-acetyltransferase n=1 Tax=Herbaspirillum rubrisubalbicans TaxID=80842 RepID=UPI0015597B15|nr:GNAT family N-acetyltransferase [Herbaspirillum rubrisubalbicans]NQE49827.1 alanine acetyltransferase [Herbaspirillum rubrisubalbicans]
MILLSTNRLTLSPPSPSHAEELLRYYTRNRIHFKRWEPKRDDDFFTVDAMEGRIHAMVGATEAQQSLHLLLRDNSSGAMIGECGFTNIVRGSFQACHLGFSLDHEFQGQGLMHEALTCAIGFVFSTLELHRIMANYRPENIRSHVLLQRLGFQQEGRAASYLKIDGEWRDHVLSSLINPSDRQLNKKLIE